MILNSKDHIIQLLKKYPHLRDSDQKLQANIWYNELKDLGVSPAAALEVLEHFAENHLTNPESIRRSRQKAQEENPELRGQRYEQRQNLEKEVRKEITGVNK